MSETNECVRLEKEFLLNYEGDKYFVIIERISYAYVMNFTQLIEGNVKPNLTILIGPRSNGFCIKADLEVDSAEPLSDREGNRYIQVDSFKEKLLKFVKENKQHIDELSTKQVVKGISM
jgi:hypothetical protein